MLGAFQRSRRSWRKRRRRGRDARARAWACAGPQVGGRVEKGDCYIYVLYASVPLGLYS